MVGPGAYEAANSLCQPEGTQWKVDGSPSVETGPVAPCSGQVLVGSWKWNPVDYDKAQGRAGNIDALPEAAGGEEAGRLIGGELLEEGSGRKVSLLQYRVRHERPDCRSSGLQPSPTGEKGECAAPLAWMRYSSSVSIAVDHPVSSSEGFGMRVGQ